MKNSFFKLLAVVSIMLTLPLFVSASEEGVTTADETTTQAVQESTQPAEPTTQPVTDPTQPSEEPTTKAPEVEKPVSLSAPVISSVKATVSGVEIKWKSVKNAASYIVYSKVSGAERKEIGRTKGTAFTDKKAVSGKSISYYVRCVDAKGKTLSSYSSAKSITYIKAPAITKFSNTTTGTKITWTECKGATSYKVFYRDSKGNWKTLATVKTTSYTHDKLKSGTTYTYTVRCYNSKGVAVGAYYTEGFKNTFLVSPAISSVSNVSSGVKVSWKKQSKAAAYRVYRKTAKTNWTEIGKTKSTSFTDKKVSSGTRYAYTVVCINSAGKNVSAVKSYSAITYIKAPSIKSFTATATGTKITWSAVKGASGYTLSYIDGNGKWKKLITTKSTSYTHDKLKSGRKYTYRLVCINSSGKAVSAYSAQTTNRFLAPPKISSVSRSGKAALIKWPSVSGAQGYMILRRTYAGKYKKLATVKNVTSYKDTSAKSNTVYSYSLRCLDSKGNVISYYKTYNKYYVVGKPAEGVFSVNGTSYRFYNGEVRKGLYTIDGSKYYYDSKGNLMKDGIVGSKSVGWYYADKNGRINLNYVNGITYKGANWIVSNGKAKKASTSADMVLFRAAKEVAKATNTSMTRAQKLRACFDYCKVAYAELNPRIPHYNGMDWPIVYANDMFIDGAGNCFSYGAAFAYMAKAIGYTNVYCCHSGGHGWAEIDGKVYDPEWSKHYHVYDYFGLDYDTHTDQDYKGAISAGYPWMHVKI